jgi:intracellular multiplication protein IcmJ
MYSLALKANPQGWRHFMARKHDKSFEKIADIIWKRDNFSCGCCGVHMQTGLEVLNIDDCYTNNALENLLTACAFCIQCRFLDSVGLSKYGGGTLVYLPEIKQSHLNGFCYALFKAMQSSTPEENIAQKTYRRLSARAQLVEEELGTGMSDPAVFGQLLIESGVQPMPSTFLNDLRLLPMWAAFKEKIAHGVIYESME